MKTIACEIVTPEKVQLREEAEFVAAPGSEGELGILPGHARLIAQLVKGEVRLVKGRETKKVTVDGGFIRIGPASVTILTPAVLSC